MQPEVALVFLYTRQNRNSFNALAGALEADPFFNSITVSFATNSQELFQSVRDSLKFHKQTIIGILESQLRHRQWILHG
jgi:hypothetical protein